MTQITKKIKDNTINTLEKKGTTTITPVNPKIANNMPIKQKKTAATVTKFKLSDLNLISILNSTELLLGFSHTFSKI